MNEDLVVILAQQGKPDAFRQIYDRHWDRIYRIAFRHTRSKPDAEDILQETFIKVFKRIKTFQFDKGTSFSAWLNTICLNCTIDHHRRQRRKHRDTQVSLSDLTRELRAQNPSPEHSAVLGQAIGRVRDELHILSPRQRLIFDMRFSQHMEVTDIAADLQCSRSNVKTQIFRALSKLRKTLKPIWEET